VLAPNSSLAGALLQAHHWCVSPLTLHSEAVNVQPVAVGNGKLPLIVDGLPIARTTFDMCGAAIYSNCAPVTTASSCSPSP
jgi:hypothetical protein